MGVHITLIDPLGSKRLIGEIDQWVEHGETIEIDGDLAERLLQQDEVWARAHTKAAKAAAEEGEGS